MVEFIKACQAGDLKRVSFLLENQRECTFDANDVELLKIANFLYTDISRPYFDSNYNSLVLFKDEPTIENALIIACQLENTSLVDLFIQSGAQNFQNGLLFASLKGNLAIAERMIARGAANVEESLQLACRMGNFTIAKYLLFNGANDVESALVELSCTRIESDECKEFIEIFLIAGNDEMIFNGCLYHACRIDNLMIAKLLIAYGAKDINNGLYYASACPSKRIVDFLLDLGADNYQMSLSISTSNFETNCNFDQDTRRTYFEIARTLLEKSATPLICCYKPMVVYPLLESGVNIEKFALTLSIRELKESIQAFRDTIRNLALLQSQLHVAKELFYMISEYSLF